MSKLNISAASLPSYKMTLPVTNQVITFRPFVVREEKVLLIALQSANQTQISDALRNVIMTCTNSTLDTKKIGVAEAEYAFLQIRSKSIGELAKPQVSCSKCSHATTIKIRLDAIEMKKSVKEFVNPNISLSSEVSVVMRYPTIHDASLSAGEVETAFQLVEQCIDSIIVKDEKISKSDITSKELNDFIENLLPDQFVLLLNFLKSTPELEYKINYKCPNCSGDVFVEVDTITNFFQ